MYRCIIETMSQVMIENNGLRCYSVLQQMLGFCSPFYISLSSL